MGEKIKVGIVAPVHDRKELTLQCLRSIGRLSHDDFEIFTVIVDDGSTDGTAEAIGNEFPDVQVIEGDGNLWFTEGTNVGIRTALERDAKYVLMINDDEVFDTDSVKYLIETAETYPRSVIGPLLLLWDTPHKVFQTAPVWKTFQGGWRHWFRQTVWTVPREPFEVDIVVGNCVLVPAAAIREAGLMNSRRYPNYGDAEYTPRLRKRGWRLLIDPRSRVFCQPNTRPIKAGELGSRLRSLIIDTRHPLNIRRRLRAMFDGAPTRASGLIAFIVFYFRAGLGRNIESEWAFDLAEEPLSETFRNRVVSVPASSNNSQQVNRQLR